METIINILKRTLTACAVIALALPGTTLMAQSSVTEKDGWASLGRCSERSPNYMLVHSSLGNGSCIVSKNGLFHVMLTLNQRFTIIISNAPGKGGATPYVNYWYSGHGYATQNPNATSLEMQGDGNLVLYNKAIKDGGVSRWSSGTYGTHADHVVITNGGELVLQSGVSWDKGPNPTLNTAGRYKHQWAEVNRNKLVKGIGGVPISTAGLHIVDYEIDKITTTTTAADLSHSSTAYYSAHNCGKGVNRPLKISQTLGADVEESQSWGSSRTSGQSTEIGVEVGVEAGIEIMKTSVSESVKNTLSSSQTRTYDKSETRSRHFSFNLEAEVDPGYYQSFLLQVNRTTTSVPFKALEIIKPAGHGPYISRNEIKSTFTNTKGRSAQGIAGDLIECRDT
ncbi:MAG: hypothetical protein MK198_09635 [Gracilimonas sp.]|uniref:hypothetical protein n=1 Tax=Gracilimonas sp. TaxID=1974203 RepID=UPI00375035C1|nr:hypothetical protein [Gracilimonas sp.]